MIQEIRPVLIEACLCDGHCFEDDWKHGLRVRRCSDCGVVHQVIAMTPAEYAAFYAHEYFRSVYVHSSAHDYAVANQRLDRHGSLYRGRTLDVGCGNGAFVNAARERGFEAYGQDIHGVDWPWVYGERLADIHFPTDYFQTVTANDVLEHIVEPKALLAEVFRIVDVGGLFILDFPDFEFAHHWKAQEHVWFLNEEQIRELLEGAGFDIDSMDRPIPGKLVFYARKPSVWRPSILIPPGIGDCYWSLVKLRGFSESRKLGIPDVWVAAADDRRRSLDFVQKIPFLKAAGYREHSTRSAVFQEAYMQRGRTVFENVSGCDYFIAFNGRMRFGETVDAQLPECPTEWYLPRFRSLEEREAERAYRQNFGPYVIAYFIPHSMYRHWLAEFPERAITQTLRKIQQERGVRIIFIGSWWDKDGLSARLVRGNADAEWIDLTGATSTDQLLAILAGAEGVVGFPSGATILATMLKRPTVMLWNKYFVEPFWRHACPPDSLDRWYRPLNTATAQPADVAAALAELMDKTEEKTSA